MNIDHQGLDPQLRAALSQEAEMQNAPEPDVDRLIVRGKVRQRHRNMVRAGAVAAVAVLVAGGVGYSLTRVDAGSSSGPAPTHSPSGPPSSNVSPAETAPQVYKDGPHIKPGTYTMLVGLDNKDVPINADLTFHEPWDGGNYPVLSDRGIYGGVAVYQPSALAAGTGCLGGKQNSKVGQTTQKLAEQLAALPRSTVLQPPSAGTAFGHPAVHVQLRVNQPCSRGIYRVAETLRGGHGISYGDTHVPVVIDFWVENTNVGRPRVDNIGAVPVVVETWHQVGASSQMLNEIASTRDSIKLQTGG